MINCFGTWQYIIVYADVLFTYLISHMFSIWQHMFRQSQPLSLVPFELQKYGRQTCTFIVIIHCPEPTNKMAAAYTETTSLAKWPPSHFLLPPINDKSSNQSVTSDEATWRGVTCKGRDIGLHQEAVISCLSFCFNLFPLVFIYFVMPTTLLH